MSQKCSSLWFTQIWHVNDSRAAVGKVLHSILHVTQLTDCVLPRPLNFSFIREGQSNLPSLSFDGFECCFDVLNNVYNVFSPYSSLSWHDEDHLFEFMTYQEKIQIAACKEFKLMGWRETSEWRRRTWRSSRTVIRNRLGAGIVNWKTFSSRSRIITDHYRAQWDRRPKSELWALGPASSIMGTSNPVITSC